MTETTKTAKDTKRTLERVGDGARDPEGGPRWISPVGGFAAKDDAVDHRILIPVAGEEAEDPDVRGILIHKSASTGPNPNYFGYSIAYVDKDNDYPDVDADALVFDDIHTSLASLCDDYGIDLDLVVDRMAMGLLHLSQERVRLIDKLHTDIAEAEPMAEEWKKKGDRDVVHAIAGIRSSHLAVLEILEPNQIHQDEGV